MREGEWGPKSEKKVRFAYGTNYIGTNDATPSQLCVRSFPDPGHDYLWTV
jgi:hypothetical protein